MDGGGPKEGGSTATPILNSLSTIATVGSTIDPNNNPAIDPTGSGTNPYGLVIAPTTAGLITAGDLVACNFNDGATNTQGHGTTIVGLHPVQGAAPYRIAQSISLEGCAALAMLPDDSISAAAFVANLNPLVTASGTVNTPFSADKFSGPWGEAYVPGSGQPGGYGSGTSQ